MKIEEAIGEAGALGLVKLIEEVDVTAGRVEVATGGGAENFEPLHAILAAERGDFRTMLFDEIDHVNSIHQSTNQRASDRA
jgi:hypothetical protein